jgi:hypothetical protein
MASQGGAPVTSTASQLENPAALGAGGQLGGAASPATWLEAGGATVAVGLGAGVVEGAGSGVDDDAVVADGAALEERGVLDGTGAITSGLGERQQLPPIAAMANNPQCRAAVGLRPTALAASRLVSVTSVFAIEFYSGRGLYQVVG